MKSYKHIPGKGTVHIPLPRIKCKDCGVNKAIDKFYKSPFYKKRYNRIHSCIVCYRKKRPSQAKPVTKYCAHCCEMFESVRAKIYCSDKCAYEADILKNRIRNKRYVKNNPEKAKQNAMRSKIRVKAVAKVTIEKSIKAGKRNKHYNIEELDLIQQKNDEGKYKYTTMELSEMLKRSVDAVRKKRHQLRKRLSVINDYVL